MNQHFDITSLEISRQDGGSVPNRYYRQAGSPQALAVLFPGLRYTCDKPLLHYTTSALTTLGMDVLQLWTDYNRAEFASLSQAEQVLWYLEDARSALQTGQGQRTYSRLVLVGKSIGTLTMALLVGQGDSAYIQASTIWLTPLLNLPIVAQAAQSLQGKALIAGGSGDATFDLQILQAIRAQRNVKILVFEGANHSLEIPGEPRRSVQILGEVVQGIADLFS
ncbi:MAG TPA: hypothetical protein VI776_13275 [Anaerolineales bacterium]|nr:hypothetical protein [Anaerolineales bacterium]